MRWSISCNSGHGETGALIWSSLGIAAIVVGVGVLGIELDGAAEVSNGAFEVLLGPL